MLCYTLSHSLQAVANIYAGQTNRVILALRPGEMRRNSAIWAFARCANVLQRMYFMFGERGPPGALTAAAHESSICDCKRR